MKIHFPCPQGVKKLIINLLQTIEYHLWPNVFLQFESGFYGRVLYFKDVCPNLMFVLCLRGFLRGLPLAQWTQRQETGIFFL